MKVHPCAELFPAMSDDQFAVLKADIADNGLQEPVKLLRGEVLDGRNRLRACLELGLEPVLDALPDDTDPLRYVVSHNLARRHLDESQRGLVAGRIANMTQGGTGANQHTPRAERPIGRSATPPVSNQAAGDLLNVSERTVRRARRVLANAVPEVVGMIEQGKVSVNAAAAVSELTALDQTLLAAQGPEAIAAAARGRGRAGESPAAPKNKVSADARLKIHDLAHKAINHLVQMSRGNRYRPEGLKLVADWIKRNK